MILGNWYSQSTRTWIYHCQCDFCGRRYRREVDTLAIVGSGYGTIPKLAPCSCIMQGMKLFYQILDVVNRCLAETNDASSLRFRLLELD